MSEDQWGEYLRAKDKSTPVKLETPEGARESELVPAKREQVREQVRGQEKSKVVEEIKSRPTKFVQRLLRSLKGEMSVLEMMAALKLGGRRNFLEKYLTPAINAGLVEMTQPDSPRSPTQRYRLTAWGQKAKVQVVRSSMDSGA